MELGFHDTCDLLGLKPNDAVQSAAEVLERHGKTFCVDFGTENAVDKACELIDAELEADLAGELLDAELDAYLDDEFHGEP